MGNEEWYGVAGSALSCVLSHQVILPLKPLPLPGTAFLLFAMSETSLTLLLGPCCLGVQLSKICDSMSREADINGTGVELVLTSVSLILLLFVQGLSSAEIAGLLGKPVRWDDFNACHTLVSVPLPPIVSSAWSFHTSSRA